MAKNSRGVTVDVTSSRSVKNAIEYTKSLGKTASISSPETLHRYAERIRRRFLIPMMRELRDQKPPKRKYPEDYPIQFVSERQRRFVMATLRGKPYRRTNGLSKGWYYRMKIKGNKITVTIGNRKNYAGYVVGKFGVGVSKRQIRRYMKPMQPYHRQTGWKPAHVTIQKYLKKAKEDLIAAAKR